MNSWKLIRANSALAVVHLQLPVSGMSQKPALFMYDGQKVWHGHPQPQSCESKLKEAFMTPTAGKYCFGLSTEDFDGHAITWWCRHQPNERHLVKLTLLESEDMRQMTELFECNIAKLCFVDQAAPALNAVPPHDAAAMLKGLQDDFIKQELVLEGCCKLLQKRARMLTALQQEQGTGNTDAGQEHDQGETGDLFVQAAIY